MDGRSDWLGDPETLPDDGWLKGYEPPARHEFRVHSPGELHERKRALTRFHGTERRPIKYWLVVDYEGEHHVIAANYCFNNGEEGLVFRRHNDDNPDQRTHVVAAFAQGGWRFYKEVNEHGE